MQKEKLEETGRTCTKVCRKCGQEKPLSEFRLANVRESRKQWHRTECKACERRYNKGRQSAHKQAGQKPNACQLCGTTERALIMDHCHDTETFRGWICQRCNHGLGAFGDSLDGLMLAVQYLNDTK